VDLLATASVPPGSLDQVATDQQFLQQLQTNLSPALAPAVVALIICLALTPLAIWLAPRLGLISTPGRERDIHTRPIPTLGGLAMYAAFAVATLVFVPHELKIVGVVLLGGVTAVMFALDDRFSMPAWLKLATNFGVAIAAVVVFGLHIDFLFLGPLQIHDLGLLILPVTVLWIVGMQNTVNLLDGVDGLAAGVVAIVALVLLIAAAGRLASPDQQNVLVMCGILAAVCLGFLVFNFHPARIFMGDSGSQFLGLALALLAVLGVAKVAVAAALLVPVLALAIPIADTGWAIIRRRRQGQSIAHADTNHVHHQLLDFGLTQPETCVVFYGTTGILGAIGLSVFGHKRVLAVAIVLIIVAISTLLGERLLLWNRRIPVPGGRILRIWLEGRQPEL
jgi:UDP-GlcNAc:undecaprenyl-phosphate GlcNAc-1-phosphate transferase